jgi:hypothetical protein
MRTYVQGLADGFEDVHEHSILLKLLIDGLQARAEVVVVAAHDHGRALGVAVRREVDHLSQKAAGEMLWCRVRWSTNSTMLCCASVLDAMLHGSLMAERSTLVLTMSLRHVRPQRACNAEGIEGPWRGTTAQEREGEPVPGSPSGLRC